MPIYEYLCQSCAHKMEALQKMSDAPLVNCPKCCQAKLKNRYLQRVLGLVEPAGTRLILRVVTRKHKWRTVVRFRQCVCGDSSDKSGADKSSPTSSVTSGSQ